MGFGNRLQIILILQLHSPPKTPPDGTLLAQFYKSYGFTTLKNSDDGIFKSGNTGGYFFYKILTNDTFRFDIQIDFESGVPNGAFYGLGIANDATEYDASENTSCSYLY